MELFLIFTRKKQKYQASTMLYAGGVITDDIIARHGVDETSTSYKEILQAFDPYFRVCNNQIIGRVKFNKQKQNQLRACIHSSMIYLAWQEIITMKH